MKAPITSSQLIMTIIFDGNLIVSAIENYRPDLLFQSPQSDWIGIGIDLLETKAAQNGYKERVVLTKNIRKAHCEKRNVYFEYALVNEGENPDYAICHAELCKNGSICCRIFKANANDVNDTRNKTTEVQPDIEIQRAYIDIDQFMHATKVSMWFYDIKTDSYFTVRNNKFEKTHVNYAYILNKLHPGDRAVFTDMIDSMLAGKNEYGEIGLRIFNENENRYRYFECTMDVCKNDLGEITHITGSQRDITEKSICEQERENTLKSLNLAMEAADITAWEYNLQTRRCQILYGMNNLELNRIIQTLISPKNDKYIQHIRNVFDNEKEKDTITIKQPTEKGGYSYYESTVSSIKNENGEITHLIGSLRNITESLIRELELKKQKDFVALALSAGYLSVWVYEIASRSFSSLEGDTLSGIGMTMEQNLEQLHPNDRSGFKKEFQAIVEGKIPNLKMELRYKVPNIEGGYGHFESSMIPIRDEQGRITHITGTQKEVTYDYFQQLELRQSKLKTDLAIQTAGIVLWEFDNTSLLFTCYNEPLNRYDANLKLTAQDYFDAAHPDDAEMIREKLGWMIEGKAEAFSYDIRIRYPDNPEWQYCTISGSPFKKDESGRVVQYVGFRKNNTELQKKKELLNSILNHVPIPIHIKDVEQEYAYTFWNEESNKMFGRAAFRSAEEIVDKETANRIHRIDRQVYDTDEPYFGQEKILTLDGRELDTIVRKSVISDGDKKLILTVRWDVGLQNELLRKSKILSISMEALKAFTWYYDANEEELIFGDGFEKTGGDRRQLNSMTAFAQQIHPDDRERFLGFMNDFLKNAKGEFVIEYRIDLANTGNYEWWECRGTVESVEKSNCSYTYVYGMDINIDAHKKNELALLENKIKLDNLIKQNELVLNNTNSGLAYINSDYIVQWENVSTCSTSLSFEAYKQGVPCYESAHRRNTPCENCVMQRATRSKQVEQMVFDFDNGKSIEVFATPVLKENEEVEGVVIRVDDITERKETISALKKAKLQAEQSDKLKSAFLANMSHEIRTPLNAIVGFSELLMETTSPDEKAEFAKIITTNNELLLKLINDILDLSKIEAGFMELKNQTFDLAECFNEIATSLQPRITNPEITFVCTNPYKSCMVKTDKSRLTQVLTNYVTNAIKYTVKGFIEMGYECVDNGVKLYVRDSGIGISEEKKTKVFQRFEKLDEFAQGTGLGLSICRAITETLGGHVGFESKENAGSTFWSWTPCPAEICEKTPSAENAPSYEMDRLSETKNIGLLKKRILIVEDIESNYLLLSIILKKNYDVSRAVNGADALEKVKSDRFDLLFMDMKMPVMGGLEATVEIRKFDKTTPIISLTAHAFESDKEAALQAGCNDYLVKPIDREKLMKLLAQYT